jgi:hypothetical protein
MSVSLSQDACLIPSSVISKFPSYFAVKITSCEYRVRAQWGLASDCCPFFGSFP